MAVTTTNRRVTLTSPGGVTTSWNVSYPVMRVQDVTIYELDNATSPPTVTTLVRDTDYTLTLDAPMVLPSTFVVDITLKYAGGLPSDHTLVVVRTTQAIQDQQFSAGDPFPEDVLELVMDRVTLLAQDTDDRVVRTIRAPDEDESPDLELPAAEDRASKFMQFDASGDLTAVTVITPGAISTSAWGDAWIILADSAAGRTTLEVPKFLLGLDAAKGVAAAFGVGFYYSTDTNRLNYSDGATWTEIQTTHPDPAGTPGHINGLRPVFSSTTAYQFTAGTARDPADTYRMTNASTFTKTLALFAEGTGNGGLGAGLSGSTYHTLFAFALGQTADENAIDFGFTEDETGADLLAAAQVIDPAWDTLRYVGQILCDTDTTFLEAHYLDNDEVRLETPHEIFRNTVSIQSGSDVTLATNAGACPKGAMAYLNGGMEQSASEQGTPGTRYGHVGVFGSDSSIQSFADIAGLNVAARSGMHFGETESGDIAAVHAAMLQLWPGPKTIATPSFIVRGEFTAFADIFLKLWGWYDPRNLS